MFRYQLFSMFRRKGFLFSFTFVLLIMLIYPIFLVYTHLLRGDDIGTLPDPRYTFIFYRYSEIWECLPLFLSLIMLFPFAYTYITDKRTHFDYVLISRSGIKKYLFSKAFCCLLGGFIIIFIPAILNISINNIFFPNTNNDISYNSFIEDIQSIVINKEYYPVISKLKLLWLFHPQLSFIVSAFYMSILGAICSLNIYTVSICIKDSKYSFLSVLPMLLFLTLSYKLQETRDTTKDNVNVLEYALAATDTTYHQYMFWIICIILILISFIIVTIKSTQDQI